MDDHIKDLISSIMKREIEEMKQTIKTEMKQEIEELKQTIKIMKERLDHVDGRCDEIEDALSHLDC